MNGGGGFGIGEGGWGSTWSHCGCADERMKVRSLQEETRSCAQVSEKKHRYLGQVG